MHWSKWLMEMENWTTHSWSESKGWQPRVNDKSNGSSIVGVFPTIAHWKLCYGQNTPRDRKVAAGLKNGKHTIPMQITISAKTAMIIAIVRFRSYKAYVRRMRIATRHRLKWVEERTVGMKYIPPTTTCTKTEKNWWNFCNMSHLPWITAISALNTESLLYACLHVPL